MTHKGSRAFRDSVAVKPCILDPELLCWIFFQCLDSLFPKRIIAQEDDGVIDNDMPELEALDDVILGVNPCRRNALCCFHDP